ncbi:MAG: HesA/MoeB/ThiF family protein, partial [Planctomycetales bacterium]|nr:HesA/MoeB/ThiF family protein [Planctomycetales bacterium]
FPVFGAVSGTVACMAAMEAIKVIADIGQPLYGRMLRFDLRDMNFHVLQAQRDRQCSVCAELV